MKTAIIFGQTYKVGLHGKVFRENEGDWLLTNNVTPFEVRKAIEDAEIKARKAEEKKRIAKLAKEEKERQKLQEILHG